MARKQTLEQDRTATLKLLGEVKVHYTEPNPNHFKMRDLNYWPSSGKVFIDGARACLPDRGLHALEAALRDRGYRRDPNALNTPPTTRRGPSPTMPTLSIELDIDGQAPHPGPLTRPAQSTIAVRTIYFPR
jgi:hypothetical protein